MQIQNKNLYQTLEDRNNPNEVECHGPYKCCRSPWFGEGYYFWDSYIRLAHWWGKIGYNGSYIICKMEYQYEPTDFFDITGSNIEHLTDFRDCIVEYFGSLNADYTIPQVIELLKSRTNLTNVFKGIRGRGNHRMNDLPENNIPFKKGKQYVFELYPPIQICFFENSAFIGYEFKIIYPFKYANQCVEDMTDTMI